MIGAFFTSAVVAAFERDWVLKLRNGSGPIIPPEGEWHGPPVPRHFYAPKRHPLDAWMDHV